MQTNIITFFEKMKKKIKTKDERENLRAMNKKNIL